MTRKLAQVLAKTDNQAAVLKANLTDYIRFFKNNQGDFKGEKKTYEPVPGYVDVPGNRFNKQVVTTVDDKLEWLINNLAPILSEGFTLEATNASGNVKAELIVEGKVWGEYSSLELLRLKSFLSNPKLQEMISLTPVRSDSKEWEEIGEGIYKTPTMSYEEKTTEKSTEILSDPNIERAIAAGKEINYTPQTVVHNKQVVIGQGTYHTTSGEWTHYERASVLKRLSDLKLAVIDALQRANQAEVLESTIDSKGLLNYLFYGAE